MRRERSANISACYMSALIEWEAKATPLGVIPRFSDDYEARVKAEHDPEPNSYIDDIANGVSVILFWGRRGIDAVCFLSADDAKAFPGFAEFSDDRLDSALNHFPR